MTSSKFRTTRRSHATPPVCHPPPPHTPALMCWEPMSPLPRAISIAIDGIELQPWSSVHATAVSLTAGGGVWEVFWANLLDTMDNSTYWMAYMQILTYDPGCKVGAYIDLWDQFGNFRSHTEWFLDYPNGQVFWYNSPRVPETEGEPANYAIFI